MGHGSEDPSTRSRKRNSEQADAVQQSIAKRPATASTHSNPEQQQRVRPNVRALFEAYNTLTDGSGTACDSGAFQALLMAAQGDIACQRLAARLVPRFIHLFPDQAEVAAGALIKLHERYQGVDLTGKPLEEHTRRDALHGLHSVLLAASCSTPEGCQAVRMTLTLLFSLLPLEEAEAPTEEPEEEEGEVTPHDNSTTASALGPWVRKALRQALQHHPVTTLAFCFSNLGLPARNSSSNRSASVAGTSDATPAAAGVRLWLRDHLLREATPSREGTPLDCDGCGAVMTAAAVATPAAAAAPGGPTAAVAAVPMPAGPGALNGTAAVGVAGAAATAHQQHRGCILQLALEGSADLRAWVRKEAKAVTRQGPEEARAVVQAAMQLMPPEPPPVKRLQPNQQQQQQPLQRSASTRNPSGRQQQQQPLQPPQPPQPATQPQLQGHQQLHKAPNGIAALPLNGVDPLSRSSSTPTPTVGNGARCRAAMGRPPEPTGAGPPWGQFPQPCGPICRLQPCVLLTNLPRHVTRTDVLQLLGAQDVWVYEQQPSAAAGGRGGSAGLCACAVLRTPLDAARTYLKHHRTNPFGPQQQTVQVLFADSLPRGSRGGVPPAAPPSLFLWALRAVTGDAERLTDDLREVGLVPVAVSRVNHSTEPGTVVKAETTKDADDMLAFMLRSYSGAAAAQQQQPQQQDQEELPPLPSEPPPAMEWAPSSGTPKGSHVPPAPAAAASAAGPHRQQQEHRSQAPLQQQHPQQGGPGPVSAFRRSSSLPVALPGGPSGPNQAHSSGDALHRTNSPASTSSHPAGWSATGPQQQQQQPAQQQWGPGVMQQQQQWQHGTTPGHSADSLAAAARPGWQHASPAHVRHQQQQQGRWPPLAHPAAAAGGPPGAALPAFPGPPGNQQQQQQQQHGTPTQSCSSPAGTLPPLPPGQAPGGAPATTPAASAAVALPPGWPACQQQYAGAPRLWLGTIHKSEVLVGSARCVEPAGLARREGTAQEPRQWPDMLHVNSRIRVQDVMDAYAGAPPHTRAVRLLLPEEPAPSVDGFAKFVAYLRSRQRAGMVKLPAAGGVVGRAVYLLVPDTQACARLRVEWDERCLMLIVVVVPLLGTAASAPAAAGAAAPAGGRQGPGPNGQLLGPTGPGGSGGRLVGHRSVR